MSRAALVALLTLLLSAFLVACGDDSGESATDGTTTCDQLAAVGAFVRLPPDDNTAVYVELTNNGDADTALVGASADFADTFELHEMVADDEGVMTMQPVGGQRIDLPAGETVTLEPGGLHVMGLGVNTSLAEGDVVPVTLEFDGGCTVTVDAEIRAVDGGMSDEGSSMDMSGAMSDDSSTDMSGAMDG